MNEIGGANEHPAIACFKKWYINNKPVMRPAARGVIWGNTTFGSVSMPPRDDLKCNVQWLRSTYFARNLETYCRETRNWSVSEYNNQLGDGSMTDSRSTSHCRTTLGETRIYYFLCILLASKTCVWELDKPNLLGLSYKMHYWAWCIFCGNENQNNGSIIKYFCNE